MTIHGNTASNSGGTNLKAGPEKPSNPVHASLARIAEDQRRKSNALRQFSRYLTLRKKGSGSIYSVVDVKKRIKRLR